MEGKSTLCKLAVVILVLLAMTIACSLPGQKSSSTIIGNWEAKIDENNTLGFAFDSSGGYNYYINGKEVGNGQYAVIDSTNPIGLDLLDSKDMRGIFTIIEFIDPNTLRMENAMPGADRPTSFSDTVTLSRVTP
jgi:hypothetical protein